MRIKKLVFFVVHFDENLELIWLDPILQNLYFADGRFLFPKDEYYPY